jgi:uncharacterized protein YceK
VAATALGGCGTSLNLDGDSRVYGGVAADFQMAKERLAQAANPGWAGTSGASPVWNLTVSALAVADVPLSILGDTLTLPYTIPAALEKRDEEDPAVKTVTETSGKSRPGGVSCGW